MPRRKPLPHDTRPDWRDPKMPVLREYRMMNGSKRSVVDPDYERRYREHLLLSTSNIDNPPWRNDPTYNLKRRRKNV